MDWNWPLSYHISKEIDIYVQNVTFSCCSRRGGSRVVLVAVLGRMCVFGHQTHGGFPGCPASVLKHP